jgi:hypothetical protein
MKLIGFNSGSHKIIASGTALTFEDNGLEILFGDAEDPLKILMTFENDEGDMRVKSNAVNGKTLQVSIFNLKNEANGISNTSPIKIGTLQNKDLHLSFMIFKTAPSALKTIHFSVFQASE